MQATYLGQIIISTADGFKLAGKHNPMVYPKTVEGLQELTEFMEEARC